jgi:hypothetical protein
MLRKHFAPTPPSEDVRSTFRVSLEEQIILVDQANEQAAKSEDLLCETERMTDLAKAIEDLAVIADGIEKPSATELDLIDNVAQMACAGTDMPPEQLLGGPELAVGQQIATENWRETAGKLWAAIKALCAKIWEAIDKFFKVHVILPTIYAKLQLLVKQMKNRTGQLKYGANPAMNVEHGMNYFSNGIRVTRSMPEFTKELERFVSAVNFVYVDNPQRVVTLTDALAAAIVKWTPETTDDVAAAMRQALVQSQKLRSSFPLPFLSNEGEFTLMSCQEVLGCTYFQFREFKDSGSVGNFEAIERLRHGGLTMLEGEEPKSDDVVFKHATAAVYEHAVQLMNDALQKIAQFNGSHGGLKQLKAARAKLEQAADHVVIEAGKMAEQQPVEAAMVKSMLDFNSALARWVQQPSVAFYTKVIGVARTLMMIIAHYNSVYEVADPNKEKSLVGELQGQAQPA